MLVRHAVIGKLNSERTVLLDQPTLDTFDEWVRHRGCCRPVAYPRTQGTVELFFVVNGCRMGAGGVRRGLDLAASQAGLGHVRPHKLRRTYATKLVNGGMSLEALMAVLANVIPGMTLC